MRSLIVYGSFHKLTNAHKLVSSAQKPPHGGRAQPEFYVRIKVFNGDIDTALSKASPFAGETVLNTVPIPSTYN